MAEEPRFLEKVFRFLKFFLGFNVRRPDIKYDPQIQEEYLTHDILSSATS